MLARQMFNKKGKMLTVTIGETIPFARFKTFSTAEKLTAYLRLKTYFLADKKGPQFQSSYQQNNKKTSMAPLAKACPSENLAKEINLLPKDCLLYQQGKYQVWCVRASQSPTILLEIGRLRELTFRQHEEGTGRSIDLDRFDQHYLHLFVWNSGPREIVGAYRIGLTDDIIQQQGLTGLYTNTLFKFREDLFTRLGPALEMGRSFVRPKYQKSFSPLLLLWQGIGRFLVNNPRYRFLFGPVSISQAYCDFSRQLMTSTLHEKLRVRSLSKFVAPRLPAILSKPKVKGCPSKLTGILSENLETIDSLLTDIEADGKGLPVLLRHYLNLGGRVLAFNLDPEFSNVIDGLVLVELEKTPYKTLRRYLGKEGADKYLVRSRHGNYANVA